MSAPFRLSAAAPAACTPPSVLAANSSSSSSRPSAGSRQCAKPASVQDRKTRTPAPSELCEPKTHSGRCDVSSDSASDGPPADLQNGFE